jgi:hypothetical protein
MAPRPQSLTLRYPCLCAAVSGPGAHARLVRARQDYCTCPLGGQRKTAGAVRKHTTPDHALTSMPYGFCNVRSTRVDVRDFCRSCSHQPWRPVNTFQTEISLCPFCVTVSVTEDHFGLLLELLAEVCISKSASSLDSSPSFHHGHMG